MFAKTSTSLALVSLRRLPSVTLTRRSISPFRTASVSPGPGTEVIQIMAIFLPSDTCQAFLT